MIKCDLGVRSTTWSGRSRLQVASSRCCSCRPRRAGPARVVATYAGGVVAPLCWPRAGPRCSGSVGRRRGQCRSSRCRRRSASDAWGWQFLTSVFPSRSAARRSRCSACHRTSRSRAAARRLRGRRRGPACSLDLLARTAPGWVLLATPVCRGDPEARVPQSWLLDVPGVGAARSCVLGPVRLLVVVVSQSAGPAPELPRARRVRARLRAGFAAWERRARQLPPPTRSGPHRQGALMAGPLRGGR